MKTFRIYAKHNDLFTFVINDNDKVLKEIESSDHSEELGIGNYDELDFEVDIKTGRILNWNSEEAQRVFNLYKINNKISKNKNRSYNIKIDYSLLKELPDYNIYLTNIEQKKEEQEKYYYSEFKKIQEEIQIYKDRFDFSVLTSDLTEGINSIYTSNSFDLYKSLLASKKLFENNIPCKAEIKNDRQMLVVHKNNAEKARNILSDVYKLYEPYIQVYNRYIDYDEDSYEFIYIKSESSEVTSIIIDNICCLLDLNNVKYEKGFSNSLIIDSCTYSKILKILQKYSEYHNIEIK